MTDSSQNNTFTRRRWLSSALIGAGAIAAGGYVLDRGIRYPRLSLEHHALNHHHQINEHVTASSETCIRTPDFQFDARFRAYVPEPAIHIRTKERQRLTIQVANISQDAILQVSSDVQNVAEQINGLTRILTLELTRHNQLTLIWRLPAVTDYRFASIGDSGGDKELAWCIERAHQLGARFLLHLGDFNYQSGDYARAITLFDNSPIPVYVTIGNHDFKDNGLIYQPFLDYIGPMNYAFTIGNTRFVNIDTAATTLPYSSGHRGALFRKLIREDQPYADTVTFTHRPLSDPMENVDHDIGNEGERDWLINALKQIDCKTLLSGHIHIYHRGDYQGIDNIIAGQGLGHQDLIVQSDYSKMVIGEVNNDGHVHYTTAPLSMPMELHCHSRVQPVKDSLRQSEQADQYRNLLDLIDLACKA